MVGAEDAELSGFQSMAEGLAGSRLSWIVRATGGKTPAFS